MTEADRAALLQAHVDAAEGNPVVWGQDDCTAWAAAWVKTVTGKGVPFLADYGSREEAHRLIDEAGGLDALWTVALSRIEIYATPYEPKLGDVGIVRTMQFGPVGVIFALDGIALWRAETGTGLLRPRSRDIVKVWPL